MCIAPPNWSPGSDERAVTRSEPKPTDQGASQLDAERLVRLRTSLSIGVILLMLVLTPAWAGLLAWGAYKILLLMTS